MTRTATSPYDVAEHLRTPEDMAAYLEAALEEASDDTTFVARAAAAPAPRGARGPRMRPVTA